MMKNPLPAEIIKLWHPNNLESPEDFSVGSGKVVEWHGVTCDHTWMRPVREQVQYKSCPYCSGVRVLAGFNDLASISPSLASEWHPTKNKFKPTEILPHSNKKIWWLCKEGHHYEVSASKRVQRNHGCPYCANKSVWVGFNDLGTKYPEVAKEWSPSNTIGINDKSYSSHYKAIWECSKGHPVWTSEIRKRTIQGQGCPVCSGNVVLVGHNDLASQFPLISRQWSVNNKTLPTMHTSGSEYNAAWECDKGHEWMANINNRTSKGSNCPQCAAGKSSSKAEEEIFDYVSSLGLNPVANSRNLIKPFELDIYVPVKNVAIEFNGIYWHSEDKKTKMYHHDKWLAAKKAGVQLIQIWEDEWNRNPNLVKKMIVHKLGESSQAKVSARNTRVIEISGAEATSFMNLNHIQGFASGSHYLGLKDNKTEKIVAVLILKKEQTPGVLNIIRYATSCHVVGGFMKLLKNATKLFNPEKYITFADHCVSDGSLYEKNGFEVEREIAPDYMYVNKGERKHKFGYRLKRFKNDPNLLWEEGLTEKELAQLNNLPRIWDAGKTKYILDVTQ